MVSGALTELAAIGNQDIYLTIMAEITFFRQLFRRHTNFAAAEIDVQFQSSVGLGRKLTTVIPRNGDLLGEMDLFARLGRVFVTNGLTVTDGAANQVVLNDSTAVVYWTNAIGHAMIDFCAFEVGSQMIDIIYGDFLHIWEQLSAKANLELVEQIGNFESVDNLRDFSARDRVTWTPLQFYFTRHLDLALPLIALQYHETRCHVVLRERNKLVLGFVPGGDFDGTDLAIPATATAPGTGFIDGGALSEAALTCKYYYLDTAERRMMAMMPMEQLITQLQYQSPVSVPAGSQMITAQTHFNHPIIEIMWVYQESRQRDTFFRYFNYGVDDPDGALPWNPAPAPVLLVDPFESVRMLLNGQERITERRAEYFRLVIPRQRHSRVPDKFVYNYTFGIAPEKDNKPQGSLNASRIDNMQFVFTFRKSTGGASAITVIGEVRIYAKSYNVAKFGGGMMALKYAN